MERQIQSIFYPSVLSEIIGEVDSLHVNNGQFGVKSITEHQPKGDGDRWYYDVEFHDGHLERIFTFNLVVFQ